MKRRKRKTKESSTFSMVILFVFFLLLGLTARHLLEYTKLKEEPPETTFHWFSNPGPRIFEKPNQFIM